MLKVTCPICGTSKSAPDNLAGKIAKCKCGELLRIPLPKDVNKQEKSITFDDTIENQRQGETERLKNELTAYFNEPSKQINVEQTPKRKENSESDEFQVLHGISVLHIALGFFLAIGSLPFGILLFEKFGGISLGASFFGVFIGISSIAIGEFIKLFLSINSNTKRMCIYLKSIKNSQLVHPDLESKEF